MKGVRYNVGRVKGRSVVVGTEMQIHDVGLLAVSSKRIVFMGEKRSMEIPLAKLLNLDMFEDGVRIHASNRQNAPLFQLQSNTPDVFGATVNAVMQTELHSPALTFANRKVQEQTIGAFVPDRRRLDHCRRCGRCNLRLLRFARDCGPGVDGDCSNTALAASALRIRHSDQPVVGLRLALSRGEGRAIEAG
jgi:hypothetical protein